MFCLSCGKEISDGAKFCSFCGVQQEDAESVKMYCAKCHKEFDTEMIFCDECGMKLSPKGHHGTTQPEAPPFNKQRSNKKQKPMEIGLASIYHGNKAIGMAMFSGTIYLYADRIETKAMLAESPSVFVKTEDIVDVSKGTFMLMWSSLILRLKSGEVFTITGAKVGSETINRAIKIINRGIFQALENNTKSN